MKIKVVITLLISLMFLSGCGGGGGNNDVGSVSSNTITELEGSWKMNLCVTDLNGNYTTAAFTFSEDNLNIEKKFYNDAACTVINQNKPSEKQVSGTFIVGKSIKTSSGEDAKEIDIIDAISGETLFQIYSILNGKLYFGDINSNVNNDGSAADKRPSDLEPSLFYTKIAANAPVAELEGTWVSVCTYVDDGDYIVTRSINGNIATSTFALYSDSTCNTLVASKQIQHKLVIGNSITTTSGLSATELDTFTLTDVPDAYDIYSIIDGKLYFGDSTDVNHDMTTVDKRPIELDFVRFFTKI